MFRGYDSDNDWPPDAEGMYERIEELGRGSYGVVWMARRVVPAQDEYDDEFVALKNIEIKAEKSYTYAAREISILRELRHPCVIRLIRAFPIWEDSSQLVAMQLARGPDLQFLVHHRGALGLPLARLVARHLVSAVSYLHGRAVIHRDVKPTNCILENTQLWPLDTYDWLRDELIWSDGPEAEKMVASNKWKLMLVDFGFARALKDSELGHDKKRGRKSIVNESSCIEDVAKIAALELEKEEIEKFASQLRKYVEETGTGKVKKRLSMVSVNIHDLDEIALDEASSESVSEPESSPPQPTTPERDTKMNGTKAATTPTSFPEESELPPDEPSRSVADLRNSLCRQSSARTKVRAMSALGTKAYAAPEILHDLRNKTEEDIEMSREALTECVADYGMTADSYSVGWTIRVVLTGVPPNESVSDYVSKLEAEQYARESGCLSFCCGSKPIEKNNLRDTDEIPAEALHLVNSLTKRNMEERMTVREAQSHPYIKGSPNEQPYKLPVGDIPAKHGDPVVPLRCSKASQK